jgi:hypothetical protein
MIASSSQKKDASSAASENLASFLNQTHLKGKNEEITRSENFREFLRNHQRDFEKPT